MKRRVNGKEMQEVDKFNYLGGMISIANGGMGQEIAHRILEVEEREHDVQRSKTRVI